MKTLFMEGGVLFMGMLSIVLLVILILSVLAYGKSGLEGKSSQLNNRLSTIKSLGLFAFVLGMLGQFIGLFSAFDMISQGMNITPALLAGGFKVSSITSIYGMIIFLISYLIWFGLSVVIDKNK